MIEATAQQLEQLEANAITLEDLNATPSWLDIEDIATIQAIQQGGCESGAYMPAVSYYEAEKAMAEHGGEIMEYLYDVFGSVPDHKQDFWGGVCSFYYSLAVELWCSQFDLEGVDWD